MKKLTVIILASILAFTSFSCSDDDEEQETQETLVGETWKFAELSIDGVPQESEKCDLEETFSFAEDNTFVQKIYVLNEQTNECDLDDELTGTWEDNGLIGGNTQSYLLKFDDDADEDIIMALELQSISYQYEVQTSSGTSRFSARYER